MGTSKSWLDIGWTGKDMLGIITGQYNMGTDNTGVKWSENYWSYWLPKNQHDTYTITSQGNPKDWLTEEQQNEIAKGNLPVKGKLGQYIKLKFDTKGMTVQQINTKKLQIMQIGLLTAWNITKANYIKSGGKIEGGSYTSNPDYKTQYDKDQQVPVTQKEDLGLSLSSKVWIGVYTTVLGTGIGVLIVQAIKNNKKVVIPKLKETPGKPETQYKIIRPHSEHGMDVEPTPIPEERILEHLEFNKDSFDTFAYLDTWTGEIIPSAKMYTDLIGQDVIRPSLLKPEVSGSQIDKPLPKVVLKINAKYDSSHPDVREQLERVLNFVTAKTSGIKQISGNISGNIISVASKLKIPTVQTQNVDINPASSDMINIEIYDETGMNQIGFGSGDSLETFKWDITDKTLETKFKDPIMQGLMNKSEYNPNQRIIAPLGETPEEYWKRVKNY